MLTTKTYLLCLLTLFLEMESVSALYFDRWLQTLYSCSASVIVQVIELTFIMAPWFEFLSTINARFSQVLESPEISLKRSLKVSFSRV
jgi:hypothetical protein